MQDWLSRNTTLAEAALDRYIDWTPAAAAALQESVRSGDLNTFCTTTDFVSCTVHVVISINGYAKFANTESTGILSSILNLQKIPPFITSTHCIQYICNLFLPQYMHRPLISPNFDHW